MATNFKNLTVCTGTVLAFAAILNQGRSGGASYLPEPMRSLAGSVTLPSLALQKKRALVMAQVGKLRMRLKRRAEYIEALGAILVPEMVKNTPQSLDRFRQGLTQLAEVERGSANVSATLGQVADLRTNFPEADFWIQMRGSEATVGKVWRTYGEPGSFGTKSKTANRYMLGVKVKEEYLDQIDPRYLAYLVEYLQGAGAFKNMSAGTLNLVHLRKREVGSIPLQLGSQGSKGTEQDGARRSGDSDYFAPGNRYSPRGVAPPGPPMADDDDDEDWTEPVLPYPLDDAPTVHKKYRAHFGTSKGCPCSACKLWR